MNAKNFAVEIVSQLQSAGYQALWAGGCVRDQLLGKIPKDYDVATDATPDQVRSLFGHKRTISIGASFGVITIIGSKESGNIEVATFRRDSSYSDGRRPDSIEFTNACEDAQRRDFTINGMFLDPLTEQIIDYVDGKADIECRIIRAIGDPEARIDEDKLRMLRAVRFAATYDFELHSDTLTAIQRHSLEIQAVSAERIGAEMRRMLTHRNRAIAVELLRKTQLLDAILQNGKQLYQNRANWRTRLKWLTELGEQGNFSQAAYILLSRLIKEQGLEPTIQRWKLANAEASAIQWFECNLMTLSRGHCLPWSVVQPLMINKYAADAVELLAVQFGRQHEGYRFCETRLQLDDRSLNPPPLINGGDLAERDIPAGPVYAQILSGVRSAQLDEIIHTKTEAIQLALEKYHSSQ